MAKVIQNFLLVIMLGCLNIPSDAQRPNTDRPFYIVSTDIISEGMEDQYLQSRNALNAQMEETGFPHPFILWKSNENQYHTWFSASELIEVRSINKSWEPFKYGSSTLESIWESVDTNYTSVLQINLDLIYEPTQPRLKDEEVQFCRLTQLYLKKGTKSIVENLIKQLIELFEDERMSVSLYFGEGVYGYESNLLFQWAFARDEEDYLQLEDHLNLEYGIEYQSLRKQILSHVKKTEHRDFHFVPGLSYNPY